MTVHCHWRFMLFGLDQVPLVLRAAVKSVLVDRLTMMQAGGIYLSG